METTVSIIAIIISLASGGFSLFTYISSVRHDRKQATLEAFNRLQNEVFDKINMKRRNEIKEIANTANDTAFTEYSQYLARIEQFCNGVRLKIYDYKTTKEIAAQYLSDIYEKSRPIIEKKRTIYPNEPQCAEFEKMLKRFKNEH